MISGFQREIYNIAHQSDFFELLFSELISPVTKKTRIFDILVKCFFQFNLLEYVKIELGDEIVIKLVSVPYWDRDDAHKFSRQITHFSFKTDNYRKIAGTDEEESIRVAWIARSKRLAKEWSLS